MTNCPNCDTKTGALNAHPHCKNADCTWTTCNCGARYDRNTSNHFIGV